MGGHNYGQGSSREHAALAPMYLGIKAIVAKSFARIHQANLINFGIIPCTFLREEDYDRLEQGNQLVFPAIKEQLARTGCLPVYNKSKDFHFQVKHDLTSRQIALIQAGGLLNYTKSQAEL